MCFVSLISSGFKAFVTVSFLSIFLFKTVDYFKSNKKLKASAEKHLTENHDATNATLDKEGAIKAEEYFEGTLHKKISVREYAENINVSVFQVLADLRTMGIYCNSCEILDEDMLERLKTLYAKGANRLAKSNTDKQFSPRGSD